MTKSTVQPRIIRASQAPTYLGMCRDEFNKTVRPNVREFPIGKRGVGFDRVELDTWADAYIAANAIEKHPPTSTSTQLPGAGIRPLSRRQPGVVDGKTAHARTTKEEFERVVERILGRPKRKL